MRVSINPLARRKNEVLRAINLRKIATCGLTAGKGTLQCQAVQPLTTEVLNELSGEKSHYLDTTPRKYPEVRTPLVLQKSTISNHHFSNYHQPKLINQSPSPDALVNSFYHQSESSLGSEHRVQRPENEQSIVNCRLSDSEGERCQTI